MDGGMALKTPIAKVRTALVADLFCGAGGSSTGARRAMRALGFDMKLVCVNHWDTAIATHQKNHPDATHYCQDVNSVRPHLAVKQGRLDLLMASPTCTFHSRARGGKPVSDQQRMDPWHIIAWLTELRVKRLIIENVPEFTRWGPVNAATGRPIKRREGEYFLQWCETIRNLGFRLDWRILNCADYGDVTTRERFFLMARSDGKALPWPHASHRRGGGASDLFGTGLKPWRGAREIIDWSLRGRSIFDRKKPLSPKTLARIYHGILKFGWPEPFIVVLRNHMTAQGMDAPLPSVTAGGTHIGVAQAFVLSRQAEGAPRSVDEPTPSQTAKQSHLLVEPLLAPYYGSGSGTTCKSTRAPLDTVTTKARFGLVTPVTHDDRSSRARSLDEPLPTVTGAHRGELAFLTAQFGERKGQAPRVRHVGEPIPTVCAQGHTDLVAAGRDYDILFRMLEPHELAAAMGFRDDESDYEFVGTKTEQIKQIGNAVPVNSAAALVRAIMEE